MRCIETAFGILWRRLNSWVANLNRKNGQEQQLIRVLAKVRTERQKQLCQGLQVMGLRELLVTLDEKCLEVLF